MNILVTGGTGFIGSHTCVELLQAGPFEVIILDNFCNSFPDVANRISEITGKSVKLYEGDICDGALLDKIFSENSIGTVLHFAGLKAVGESCERPLEYFDNNVSGTITLLKAMERAGVRKIIFSSSATVYGENCPAPCHEDMPTGAVCNPYGQTKHMVELMLSDLCKFDRRWSAVLLRYFNPVGAHESGKIGELTRGVPSNLMPYILKVASGELPHLTVFGDGYDTPDGTCIRDYIHVMDLAKGHVLAAKKLSEPGAHVYNLGTSRGYSVLEIVKAFEAATGVKVPFVIGPARKGDLPKVYADTTRAREDLGFVATCNLDKMCINAWNWQKNLAKI